MSLTKKNIKSNFKEFDLEKGGKKTGYYTNTSENRKKGVVGQKYKKDPSEKETFDYKALVEEGTGIEILSDPTEKDMMRIDSLYNRSKGNMDKFTQYAQNMANAIGSKEKAMQRGGAANEILGPNHPVTQVFVNKVKSFDAPIIKEEKKVVIPEEKVIVTKEEEVTDVPDDDIAVLKDIIKEDFTIGTDWNDIQFEQIEDKINGSNLNNRSSRTTARLKDAYDELIIEAKQERQTILEENVIDINTFKIKRKPKPEGAPYKKPIDHQELFWKTEDKNRWGNKASEEQRNQLNSIVGYNNDIWQKIRKEQKSGYFDFDNISVTKLDSKFENEKEGYVGRFSGDVIVNYKGTVKIGDEVFGNTWTENIDTRGFF